MPNREQLFTTILDVLKAANPSSRFVALDLGCGPGSLSERVLERFPRSKLVSIDYDPVVLKIGEMALKKFRKRINWLEADLGARDLVEQLAPFHRFDAAISSTALHWLYQGQLRSLYRNLAKVLRPRGVFVNCDPMPSENNGLVLRHISKRLRKARSDNNHREWQGWSKWWKDLQKDPYFDELFRIRKTRYPDIHSHAEPLPLEFHEKTLKEAGFREVGVLWQDLEQKILVGVR